MIWTAVRVRLLGRFYLIVALIATTVMTGMATGFELFFRVLYVLGITAVFSFIWNLLSVQSLEVEVDRRTPRVRVGEDVEEGITVRNLSILPKHSIEVEDLTSLPGASNATAISVSSKGSAYWDAETRARKRGVYTLGPVRVSNTDPFGMFRRERLFGSTENVVVYPRVYDLDAFHVPASDLMGETSMMTRTHNVTPQASTVRDYAFGDSFSRIHWPTTAKQGRLMSKEFDLGRAGEMWLLVDLHEEFQAGEMEDSTDEYAVSVGASLAKRYIQSMLPVGLIAYGDQRHFLPAETGAGQFERILDTLALSKASGVTPLEVVLPKEEPLWGHRSSLVVITASPRREWVLAVGELARRGVRVAAVLVDSDSFGARFNSLELTEHLMTAGIATYLVRKGDDIRASLGRPYSVPGAALDQLPGVEATV